MTTFRIALGPALPASMTLALPTVTRRFNRFQTDSKASDFPEHVATITDAEAQALREQGWKVVAVAGAGAPATLVDIEGIGDTTAETLAAAGLDTPQRLHQAHDDDVAALELPKKARAAVDAFRATTQNWPSPLATPRLS